MSSNQSTIRVPALSFSCFLGTPFSVPAFNRELIQQESLAFLHILRAEALSLFWTMFTRMSVCWPWETEIVSPSGEEDRHVNCPL